MEHQIVLQKHIAASRSSRNLDPTDRCNSKGSSAFFEHGDPDDIPSKRYASALCDSYKLETQLVPTTHMLPNMSNTDQKFTFLWQHHFCIDDYAFFVPFRQYHLILYRFQANSIARATKTYTPRCTVQSAPFLHLSTLHLHPAYFNVPNSDILDVHERCQRM